MIRIHKASVIIRGKEKIVVNIRDYTDIIKSEKAQVRKEQHKFSQVVIGKQLNTLVKEHKQVLSQVSEVLDAQPQFTKVSHNLKQTFSQLFVLYWHYRDLDIRLAEFVPKIENFRPIDFFNNFIATQAANYKTD